MKLDFWNNPLVVSAVRLKFRRNSPALMASIWVLALVALGGAVNHIAPQQNWPFPESYLTAILAVQFVISGGIALFSTSSSINAEVTNRTLDFQRIVSLRPQSILVGKMLGEPVMGYLLAVASIPLAVVCSGLGAVSPLGLLMLNVNLCSTILLMGALGLIHTLILPAKSEGRQRSGGGGVAIVIIVCMQLLDQGARARHAPGITEAIHLLTPVGSLIALWEGNSWNARAQLWGLGVPSLAIVPVVQLAIAAWIVAAMSRRLKNPLDPMVTKKRGYLTVAACDAVIAAVCFAQWRQGVDPIRLVYGYCFAHVVLCVLLLFAMVPRRAAISAWLWRRDPRQSRWRDLLFGDRSEVTLAGVVLGLVGIAVMLLAFVIPVLAEENAAFENAQFAGIDVQDWITNLSEASVATLVLVVAAAATHQLMVVTVDKGGQLLYILLLFLANMLPPLVAGLLDLTALGLPRNTAEMVALFSPVAYYIGNAGVFPVFRSGTIGIILTYTVIAVASHILLRIRLLRQTKIVRHKLQSMGVQQG